MARLQLKLEFRLHANLALLIILDGNINFHQQNQSFVKILTLHSCWIHPPYCFCVLIRAEFLKPYDWSFEIADEIIYSERFFVL